MMGKQREGQVFMFALQTPLLPWPRICLFGENDQGFFVFS